MPLFSVIVFSSKNIDKTGAKKTSPGYLNQIESNILIKKLKLKILKILTLNNEETKKLNTTDKNK